MTPQRGGLVVGAAVITCAFLAIGACAAGVWPTHLETLLYLGTVANLGLAELIHYWPLERAARTTTIPYDQWPLWARIIEQLYRRTHHGRVRTLVVWSGAPWWEGRGEIR